jgi:hypothetical protein
MGCCVGFADNLPVKLAIFHAKSWDGIAFKCRKIFNGDVNVNKISNILSQSVGCEGTLNMFSCTRANDDNV